VRGLSKRRQPVTDAAAGDVSGVVVRLVDGAPMDARTRARLLRRLAVAMAASARLARAAGVGGSRWFTDTVVDFAPHLPIRDLPTLRAHHDGLAGDALATVLVEAAAHATGAVGAAAGVVSTLELAAPPLLLTSPVQVMAETLAVVAIELKLVAELHEVYGHPVIGTPAVRTAAYLGSWTRRRGVDPRARGVGVGGLMTGAARHELQRRLVRRGAENSVTVLPFMAGAVAGASLNSRETRKLGQHIAKDLGGRLR
jgi:hypothetical protein